MSGLADRIDTAGLDALAGFAFPTFASRGGQTSAVAIAERCQRAQNWLADIFGQRPEFTLIIANRDDWQHVALIPLYGMPHAVEGVIVTGTEPSDFWADYTGLLLADLPAAARQRLRAVYGDPPELGERFADLVVVHELTHLYHHYDEQTGRTDFARLWLAELFANLGLHGYIADNEPTNSRPWKRSASSPGTRPSPAGQSPTSTASKTPSPPGRPTTSGSSSASS